MLFSPTNRPFTLTRESLRFVNGSPFKSSTRRHFGSGPGTPHPFDQRQDAGRVRSARRVVHRTSRREHGFVLGAHLLSMGQVLRRKTVAGSVPGGLRHRRAGTRDQISEDHHGSCGIVGVAEFQEQNREGVLRQSLPTFLQDRTSESGPMLKIKKKTFFKTSSKA